jgi:hypothetical protein
MKEFEQFMLIINGYKNEIQALTNNENDGNNEQIQVPRHWLTIKDMLERITLNRDLYLSKFQSAAKNPEYFLSNCREVAESLVQNASMIESPEHQSSYFSSSCLITKEHYKSKEYSKIWPTNMYRNSSKHKIQSHR